MPEFLQLDSWTISLLTFLGSSSQRTSLPACIHNPQRFLSQSQQKLLWINTDFRLPLITNASKHRWSFWKANQNSNILECCITTDVPSLSSKTPAPSSPWLHLSEAHTKLGVQLLRPAESEHPSARNQLNKQLNLPLGSDSKTSQRGNAEMTDF